MNWGRIAIGLRCGYGADPAFVCSWTDLLMGGLRDGDEVMPPACESYHSFTAEKLARTFLAGGCDSLLFVDDDMVFGVDDLARLRDDVHGGTYGILSALYVQRRDRKPIIYARNAAGDAEPVDPVPGTIMDSAFVGLGFCLVRRVVLQALADKTGPRAMIFHLPTTGIGEDVVLCDGARALGYRVGVHVGVSIGHRGKTILRWIPQGHKE